MPGLRPLAQRDVCGWWMRIPARHRNILVDLKFLARGPTDNTVGSSIR
jgi:hypothetical protein